MQSKEMSKIVTKVEQLLDQEIPIELKAHRIVVDIFLPLLDEVRSEYEKLWFVNKSKNGNH